MMVSAGPTRPARAFVAWPTGSKRSRGGWVSRARWVEGPACLPRSRSACPTPRLENIGRRERAALEGEHVPIETPTAGEGLPSVYSLGESQGDRLPVKAVGTRCGGVLDVVSLGEGDAP